MVAELPRCDKQTQNTVSQIKLLPGILGSSNVHIVFGKCDLRLNRTRRRSMVLDHLIRQVIQPRSLGMDQQYRKRNCNPHMNIFLLYTESKKYIALTKLQPQKMYKVDSKIKQHVYVVYIAYHLHLHIGNTGNKGTLSYKCHYKNLPIPQPKNNVRRSKVGKHHAAVPATCRPNSPKVGNLLALHLPL